MPNNELQEILSARFREHTQPADEAVWNAIEARLDAQESDRVGIWFWLFNGIAVAVFASAMVFSGMFDTSVSTNNTQLTEITKGNRIDETNEGFLDRKGELISNRDDRIGDEELSQEEPITETKMWRGRSTSASTDDQEVYRNITVSSKEEVSVALVDQDLLQSKHNVEQIPLIDALQYRPIPSGVLHRKLAEFTSSIEIPSNSFSRRIPLHLGFELTYLNRTRDEPTTVQGVDTTYMTRNNQLASNRHVEISVFSQFDLSNRFSASVGLGYSQSKSSSVESTLSWSMSSTQMQMESDVRLITVPIQAKFNFFRKKGLRLYGGLTAQGEFGKVVHREIQTQENWTTTTSVPESLASSFTEELSINQLAVEPFVQLSVNLLPRITTFANAGYRVYLAQRDQKVAPIGRLNYVNADFGVLYRLR